GVDIQPVERPVRVVAGAVGVVGPAPVERPLVKVHGIVIAEIKSAGRRHGPVGRPGADLDVGTPGGAAVQGGRAKDLHGVVGGGGIAGVVPGDGDVAGG